MNPQVIAALIAAGVGLIGTVVVAIVGFRTTRRVAERTIEAGHEDTSRTLAEQRSQLERTLDEQHVRTLNERFASAADQLGTDKPSAVRLAGAYAMAKLADDWEENRQTCVDVLCACLRLPYEPDPGDEAPAAKRLEFRASQEVRHTVIRVITGHLKAGVSVSWQGLDFDFTSVVFDGGDFTFAEFSGGVVRFDGARFSGGTVRFDDAEFSGSTVSFGDAEFSGGEVSFDGAKFSGGAVRFIRARFSGGTVSFDGAEVLRR